MIQHLYRRPEGADGIGDAFADDVEGRAMDRLEHRREAPLGVDVRGGRDANRASQCGGKIGEDVGVQVGGDHRVEAGR